MSLTIASRTEHGANVVDVAGDIDVQSAAQLRDALTDFVPPAETATASRDLVVDLGGTDFLDSSALGVLVAINKQFESGTTRFSIVCDKPHLLRVFEITRLREVFRIVPTVDAALA